MNAKYWVPSLNNQIHRQAAMTGTRDRRVRLWAGCPTPSRSAGWGTTLAMVCGLMAIVAAAMPARGQCSPQELAKLIASDAAAGDVFGASVAVSGDTAVVGAVRDSHAGGDTYEGSAYVFVRAGGVWTQQAKLIASDAAANDLFGISVAVSGDTAVVGAYGGDHAGGDAAGSAYVFVRSGGVWTQQAKLTASDAAVGDAFGYSVAVSGDSAVVGAINEGNTGPSMFDGTGSAYVFVRSSGVWTERAKLTASDAAAYDRFGRSVAVSGDTAVVGAENDGNTGPTAYDGAGSAYVFTRSGGVWTQQVKLTASDAAGGDIFGASVAVSAETTVVGAFNDGNTGPSTIDGTGSAYVFVHSSGVWTEQAKLTASDAAAYDYFGFSVAVSGDTAVVGAIYDDHAGGTDAGSAYVFALGCDTDGDGVPNASDVCPNNTPGLPVDCAGRPHRDCNNDCLVDAADIQCIVDEMLNQ